MHKLLLIIAGIATSISLGADTVTNKYLKLGWEPSLSANVRGYYLYNRDTNHVLIFKVFAGDTNRFLLNVQDLTTNKVNVLTVTAVDSNNIESPPVETPLLVVLDANYNLVGVKPQPVPRFNKSN